jgi:hypothetical protein
MLELALPLLLEIAFEQEVVLQGFHILIETGCT